MARFFSLSSIVSERAIRSGKAILVTEDHVTEETPNPTFGQWEPAFAPKRARRSQKLFI
jgi:hypothetical protein